MDRLTLNYDSDDLLGQRISAFAEAHPGHPLDNLYDLHFRFFESLESMARKALATGQGLAVMH